jgi:hypothetical protein
MRQESERVLNLTKKILEVIDSEEIKIDDARSALHAAEAILPASDCSIPKGETAIL